MHQKILKVRTLYPGLAFKACHFLLPSLSLSLFMPELSPFHSKALFSSPCLCSVSLAVTATLSLIIYKSSYLRTFKHSPSTGNSLSKFLSQAGFSSSMRSQFKVLSLQRRPSHQVYKSPSPVLGNLHPPFLSSQGLAPSGLISWKFNGLLSVPPAFPSPLHRDFVHHSYSLCQKSSWHFVDAQLLFVHE